MPKRLNSHRSLPVSVCLAMLALMVPASALGATRHRTDATLGVGSTPGLIPVWAYVNGVNPVAGGRVSIMAGGRPVSLADATTARTNARGVALVSVARLPRRFTVVVRGGRAAGRRVLGSLRSLAVSDRNAAVVEVNPLTTLIRQLRVLRPQLVFGRASRAVKRYFDVPQWADLGQDLRSRPRWFSAVRYLRDARRHGSIGRLNRSVARAILRAGAGSGRTRRAPTIGADARDVAFARRAATAPHVGFPAAIGAAATTPGLVGKVFKALGKATGEAAFGHLIGGGLGALLALAKEVGIPFPESEFDKTRRQLEQISAQLTALQGQVASLEKTVAKSHASQLLHQSDPYTASIDHAETQLAFLANANHDDPTLPELAATTAHYIGKNLLDAPAYFNRFLNSDLVDNPIKATSHALAVASTFFGPHESGQVRAVYDYYATYQAQLGVLLMNYWNTKPMTYSVQYRKTQIKALEENVETSAASLKPAVPDNAVMDIRSREMWTTNFPTVDGKVVTLAPMGLIATIEREPGVGGSSLGEKYHYRLLAAAGPIALGNLPFKNWRVPDVGRFKRLLNGWNGSSRLDWLHREGGFDPKYLSTETGLMWTSETPAVSTVIGISSFDVRRFSVRLGEFHSEVNRWADTHGWKPSFRGFKAGLMYYRTVPVSEQYWW